MNGRSLLKKLIKEYLMNEADIEDLGDICYSPGSTHEMKTCTIGGNKYFLKFSSDYKGFDVDPSLQVLIEYLAYRIYGLYKEVSIPEDIQLVFDKSGSKVGIASSPAAGAPALPMRNLDRKKLAKALSAGVYVDVLLANWDVVGTGTGNVFYDETSGKATRIDPGASGEFRAQGGRKPYSQKVGELETMLKRQSFSGSGDIFQYADLKEAAQVFLSVTLNQILDVIAEIDFEVASQLEEKEMSELLSQWTEDVDNIKSTLPARHKEISLHANFIMNGGKL